MLDADGSLFTANRALCEMLGYDEPELRALPIADLTHPDDLAEDLALLEQTVSGEVDTYRLTKRYLLADGSVG